MFALSLLLLVLMVNDSHGDTISCDRKIESLRIEVSSILNENKIMKAQLSDLQRMKSELKDIAGEFNEFRLTRK